MRTSDPREAPVPPCDDELRCACGRLLARVVEEGIELRCSRCKRAHVLPWSSIEGASRLTAALLRGAR